MTTPACPSYAGYRFPAEILSHAVWLYFRFPLSLRMMDELLAARGIIVSHETVRQWALKFGQAFANQLRRRLPRAGDKWHLDEVVLTIAGVKHWLWRAVDQTRMVLDILVQSRRDTKAAKRLLRKLLKRQCRPPRVMITGDQQPLPPPPPSSACHPVSSRPHPSLPGLGGDHRRHRCGTTTGTPSQSRAIAT
jgi:putative transposase